jgi:uncharacterized protein with GYD domain
LFGRLRWLRFRRKISGGADFQKGSAGEVVLPGRIAMTTYIVMINWTEQGIKNVRDSPKRLDAAKRALEAMGGSFKDFYLTMGECDMVAICEAPDDAVLARFSLTLGMGGNVRTRTLKAFPEKAYRELIATIS